MSVVAIGSSYRIENVSLKSAAATVGPKEGQGPLGADFDQVFQDHSLGQTSSELAERQLLMVSQIKALEKAGLSWDDVSMSLGGDLLDQIVSTNFAAREHKRPLVGLFSACAVFSEGLGVGSLLLAGGGPNTVLVSASSHHLSAERQFRFPVELGYQRTPTAAWTATAAGSAVLMRGTGPIRVESVTLGRVIDFGTKDPNDMGTAMAPAAFDTLSRHLRDTHQSPRDYDAIYTGDLGQHGLLMLREYAKTQGLALGEELHDAGRELYHLDKQDVHNGGSGPGCSASVFCGPLFRRLERGEWHRLLLIATGALFSPTTYQQGESIPCIAHAIAIVREESR